MGSARDRSEKEEFERLFRFLGAVNHSIFVARSQRSLMRRICAAAVDEGGFEFAAYFQVSPRGEVRKFAAAGSKPAGLDEEHLRHLCARIAQEEIRQQTTMRKAGNLCILLPLWHRKRCLGTLILCWKGQERFGRKSIEVLPDVLGGIGYGLALLRRRAQFAKLTKRLERHLRMEAALSGVIKVALESYSLEEVLQQALKEMMSLGWLAFEAKAAVFLLREEGLVLEAHLGLGAERLRACGKVALGECLCGEAAKRRQPVLSLQVGKEHKRLSDDERDHGDYCVPIMRGEELLGVLHLYLKAGHKMDEGQVSFVKGVSDVLAALIARVRAEEAAQKVATLYRDILESTTDLVQSVDMNGRFLYVNRAWLNALGYTEEDVKKMTMFDVLAPAAREHCAAIFEKAKAGKQLESFGTVFLTKDGREVELEGTCNLQYEGGKPVALRAMFRDVTKRKEAERQARKAQAQLLRAQKMEALGLLASGVAHDFNNVLTAIQGTAELALMEVPEDSPTHQTLRRILAACKRGASLARQLLLFSRKQPVKPKPLNLNRTIENLLKMLERLIGENIKINAQLEPALWTVIADEGGIEQVLMNLVVNARDAMPNGGTITIRTENIVLTAEDVQIIPNATPGRFVRLSVSDTGVGMDKKTLEHIFEPFFTTKREGKGTGLGLAVVYGVVRQHNGWINVYSEPGNGTTFKIYLPVAKEVSAKDEEEKTPEAVPAGNGEIVLVVEDEERVRFFTTHALISYKYKAYEAATVKDALKVSEKLQKLDLLFTDIALPDGKGEQLVTRLRKKWANLPAILTSGYSVVPKPRKRVLFLQKPYGLMELLRTVHRALHLDE
ncbi:MAG: hypothetical protein DRP63_05635 [Planctomycetota bacterium]|nr:MAG: hypothetical protein DRP63_05635 [Planctomycetota bacterium]